MDASLSSESEEQVDMSGENYIDGITDDDIYDANMGDDIYDANVEDDVKDVNIEEQLEHLKGTEPVDSVSSMKDEDKQDVSMNEDDSKVYAKLLALPPRGSEVFIGGIPRDATEEDLKELCEPIGEISEIRMLKDNDAVHNKGYAFITFKTNEMALKAIKDVPNKEFKGKRLRCSLSQTKYRLFIGNIPKSWTEGELRKVVEENSPGVETIELPKDPQNSGRNRGFAFVEYYNHACADYAREKMSSKAFKLDDNTPTISWADSKNANDPSAQVKAVFVKNLPEKATIEHLRKLFECHGEISKIVIPAKRDFGFIYFAERSSALQAVKECQKYEIDGHTLNVSLAKPQSDKSSAKPQSDRKIDISANSSRAVGIRPSYVPHGFIGNPYGFMGLYQPAGLRQGLTQEGTGMVPMVLPDGRMGYILQQPPLTPWNHRNIDSRRSDNHHDSWNRDARHGRGRDDNHRGSDRHRDRRYHPY